MFFDIKNRLKAQGRKQAALLPILRQRGFKVDPSMLSDALHGRRLSASYQAIVSESNEIVSMWERQAELLV